MTACDSLYSTEVYTAVAMIKGRTIKYPGVGVGVGVGGYGFLVCSVHRTEKSLFSPHMLKKYAYKEKDC